MEMLEDISDGIQYHPNINRREARSKICDRIKQGQSEWKGAFKATQNMGKVLHKVFKNVVNEIFSCTLAYTSRPYLEAMYMHPDVTYTLYATSSK